jgi:hypothetical protein
MLAGVAGNPSLIQGKFGTQGNFELVVPLDDGGLAHYWRNNDAANLPWSQPTVFGQNLGNVQAVSLIQSNFGGSPGNLEVVARDGNRLVSFWRGPGPWNGPIEIAT